MGVPLTLETHAVIFPTALILAAIGLIEQIPIAAFVGVIMSALGFAWNAAKTIQASKRPCMREKGAIVYDIKGPLFSGSITGFRELFRIKDDPEYQVAVDYRVRQGAFQSGH